MAEVVERALRYRLMCQSGCTYLQKNTTGGWKKALLYQDSYVFGPYKYSVSLEGINIYVIIIHHSFYLSAGSA